MLEPGGSLLDLHPTPPFASVESGGRSLGALEEAEFMELVAETKAGLDEAVNLGLFVPGRAVRFDVVERFDTAKS